MNVVLPFIEKVKAVKNTTLSSLGFIASNVQTKDGASVDAYAIALYKTVDAYTVRFYD